MNLEIFMKWKLFIIFVSLQSKNHEKIRIGLLPRIILAIGLGILFGTFLPSVIVRFFITVNSVFSEFLGFTIPLIIVGLVTVAIADIGNKAGKLLLITVLIAYGSTVFAGFLSYFTGATFFPSMIDQGSSSLKEMTNSEGLAAFITIRIPPLMDVMTALILAFTLGLGLAHLNSNALKNVAKDFQDIIIKVIHKVIIPVLPLYIFGIFLNMTHFW